MCVPDELPNKERRLLSTFYLALPPSIGLIMKRPQPITLVVMIMVLGLLISLPFRKTPHERIKSDAQIDRSSLPLRALNVPLLVSPPLEVSPVADYSHDSQKDVHNASSSAVAKIRVADQLDGELAPPTLASQYRPRESFKEDEGVPVITSDNTDVNSTYSGHWETHRIRDGDTLKSIAKRYFADEVKARAIYEANRKLLKDPEILPLGLELRIPKADEVPIDGES